MYATIFRLAWPYLQRFLAKQATQYLQIRREQRLQARDSKEPTVTSPAQKSEPGKPPESPPIQARFAAVEAVWFTLSGVLLGSAISVILAQIFLRED